MKTLVALFLAMFCACAPAAEFINGELLYQFRKGTDKMKDQSTGYIVGVHDAQAGAGHCSEDMSVQQLLDATDAMLEAVGPIRAQVSADLLIGKMLADAFPCGPDKPAAAPQPRSAKRPGLSA